MMRSEAKYVTLSEAMHRAVVEVVVAVNTLLPIGILQTFSYVKPPLLAQ